MPETTAIVSRWCRPCKMGRHDNCAELTRGFCDCSHDPEPAVIDGVPTQILDYYGLPHA